MKTGDARQCGCGKSLYIATNKIAEINSALSPASIINAIDSSVVKGCNRKSSTFGAHKLRNVSHITFHSFSNNVTSLFGMLLTYFQYLKQCILFEQIPILLAYVPSAHLCRKIFIETWKPYHFHDQFLKSLLLRHALISKFSPSIYLALGYCHWYSHKSRIKLN